MIEEWSWVRDTKGIRESSNRINERTQGMKLFYSVKIGTPTLIYQWQMSQGYNSLSPFVQVEMGSMYVNLM